MHTRLITTTLVLSLAAMTAMPVRAQSTFGAIIGSVQDASGSAVADAEIRIRNTGENTARLVKSSQSGAYEALNLRPGRYQVTVTRTGFQTFSSGQLALDARQTIRVDASLQVGRIEESVTVESQAGVIASETATVASSIGSERVLNLPANFRASGSTSPYRLIATLPGVQGDNGDNFSIQGALPAQTQASVDGITLQHPRNNSPIREAFPSAESIGELKVQGVLNAAEYGGVGDITVVSKSGTNQFHGGAFWYHQNRALDAKAYGALSKPRKVANDAGFYLGGPVTIPRLYQGKDKTFFYFDLENFTYPVGRTIQNTVPTDSLRRGDFSADKIAINDPATGLPFAGSVIPASRISSIAAKVLTLYPTPNYGATTTFHSPNYVSNQSADRPSFQWDLRGDHYINNKQSFFVRWSQKDIDQKSPNGLLIPYTALNNRDRSLTVSHNYTISSKWLNEFRLGYSLENPAQNFGFDGTGFANSLGLKDVGPFLWNGLPDIQIDQFSGVGVDRVESNETYRTFQVNNNTTWVQGRHTVKFGADVRLLRSKTALGFIGADNFGNYNFGGAFSGSGFADFLLGLPSDTSYGNVTGDNDGRSVHYHLFVQDSFRATRKLTLELGLRYELHPPFQDQSGNIGNFDRTVAKTGRVIYPSSPEAGKLLAPGLLLSVNACAGTPNLPANTLPGLAGVPCTPFVTASQAGLPEGLRINYKLGFLPRFGFAYRPFGDSKTVVRGGFGMYNMSILGAVFYSLTGTAQTDVRTFSNIGPKGQPLFGWPNSRPSGATGVAADNYGTSYFGTANAVEFKNPNALQFNLSVDRSIGGGTGLRVSYIGLKSTNLPYAPNLNQSYYSTQYYALQPLQARPFPYWGRVESRDTGGNAMYNALQVEASHRLRSHLTFNAAYTWAKNLNDTGGPNPSGFGGETGNGRIMDSLNRAGSRGNDYATRRHRFIGSALYALPFGRGQKFGGNLSRPADLVLGGWELSSILLLQTGPYMTPSFGSGVGDPSGTGSGFYRSQRPDLIGNPVPSNQTQAQWIDRNAFVCPGRVAGSATQFNCGVGLNPASGLAPIGRFGNSGVGIVEGPGTVNLSMSLGKSVAITERVKLRLAGSFTNLPNHPNLADPSLNITSSAFGRISSARASEFGGSRTGEVSARLTF